MFENNLLLIFIIIIIFSILAKIDSSTSPTTPANYFKYIYTSGFKDWNGYVCDTI